MYEWVCVKGLLVQPLGKSCYRSPFSLWPFHVLLSQHTAVVIMYVTSGHIPNIARPFGSTADRFIYCWFHFRFSFPCLPPCLDAAGGSRLSPAGPNLSLNDPDCSPQRFGHNRDLVTKIRRPTMFSPLALVLPHLSPSWYRRPTWRSSIRVSRVV